MIKTFRKKIHNYKIKNCHFFKKYPPKTLKGGLTIDYINNRGVIDIKNKIFYNDIPKAASSTVIFSLARLLKNPNIKSRSKAKDFFVTPNKLSKSLVQDFDQFFKFTFVRNPYDRVLSAYLDKATDASYLEKESNKDLKKTFKKHFGSRTPSFKDFVYYLNDGGMYDDGHWAPQTEVMLIPFGHLNMIGKVENFETDIMQVFSALNLSQAKESEIYRAPDQRVTNAHERKKLFYTEKLYNIVYDLYKPSFEAFDYPYKESEQ